MPNREKRGAPGASAGGPPARMLGHYHVLDELGRDRVGVVHLARLEGPNGFQRWARLRILHGELAAKPEYVTAFYEAASSAARVQHANVETTFDVGEQDGEHWVALEYIHGETAEELLVRTAERQTQVPWDIACRIIADAALGLDAIHDVGHAEVSPHELAITYDGKTKVLDACVPSPEGRRLPPDARSLPYLAPEQGGGDLDDDRTDLFGLGVILWELCAGRRLFTGKDPAETRALLEARVVPSLHATLRGFPSHVEHVIARSLAREQDARFPNAREMARALQASLVTESLVVTDEDVGRFILSIFAERFNERESRLRSAADVTEVFRRSSLFLPKDADTQRELPDILDDDSPTHIISRDDELDDDELDDDEKTPAARGRGSSRPVAPDMQLGGRSGSSRPPVPRPAQRLGPGDTQPAKVIIALEAESEPVTVKRDSSFAASVAAMIGKKPQPQRPPSQRPPPPHRPPSQRPPSQRPPAPSAPEDSDVVVPRPAPLPKGTMRLPTAQSAPPPPALMSSPPQVAPPPEPLGIEPALTPPPPNHQPPPQRTTSASPASFFGSAGPTMPIRAYAPHGTRLNPLSLLTIVAVAAMAVAVVLVVEHVFAPTPEPEPSFESTAPLSPTAPPADPSVGPVGTIDPSSSAAARAPAANLPTTDPRAGTATPGAGRGLLTIVCNPACDEVLDGASSLGPSPVIKAPVAAGPHRITLRASDPRQERIVNVVVTADDTTVVRQPMN